MLHANSATIEAEDLPTYDNPHSWFGPDMALRTDWIHELSTNEIAELDVAVFRLDAAGTDIRAINRGMFPLPQCQQ
jgi:hypothetical protein